MARVKEKDLKRIADIWNRLNDIKVSSSHTIESGGFLPRVSASLIKEHEWMLKVIMRVLGISVEQLQELAGVRQDAEEELDFDDYDIADPIPRRRVADLEGDGDPPLPNRRQPAGAAAE